MLPEISPERHLAFRRSPLPRPMKKRLHSRLRIATRVCTIMSSALLILCLLGVADGFVLASPRRFDGLRARSATMNVGDEGLLQDAVKEVFDPDECKVDAESAEELAS